MEQQQTRAGKGSSKVLTELDSIGHLPPHDVATEQAVLGAMLLERDSRLSGISFINDYDLFYYEKNQIVYSAIKSTFDEGQAVDLITIIHKLRSIGKLEFVGGPVFIAELCSKVSSATNMAEHIAILKEFHVKRKLISLAAEIQKKAYDYTEDALEILSETNKALVFINDQNVSGRSKTAKQLVKESLERLNLNIKARHDGTIMGMPTGIKELDNCTGGWQDGDLVIIAGRPGMGKTATLIQFAKHPAIRHNKKIGIFSLEMTSIQIMDRMISSESLVQYSKFSRGNVKEEELAKIHLSINSLLTDNIHVDDTPSISISVLRAKAYMMKLKHGIQMIIVDYLQLMSSEKKTGNREQEVSEISRGLKLIAKELKIPVIALAQLSRAVESRGGSKIPQLSDLRESGGIEQDADTVIFNYRPEYYKIDEIEIGDCTHSSRNLMMFIIAKQRNGPTINVPAYCDISTNTFKSFGWSDNDKEIISEKSNHDFFAGRVLPPEDNESPF